MKQLSMSAVVLRVALGGLALLATAPAQAVTYNVNTTADLPDDGLGVTACHTSAGNCSLRAAIMKANQVDGTNIIHVPAGIYVLSIPPTGNDGDDRGDLNITKSVSITGQGAGRTIIDGNHSDRVFDIAGGQFVGLTGLTIRNGDQRENGGGIRNAGLTTIVQCAIEENTTVSNGSSGHGAGIYSSGSLDVLQSTIRSNHVQGPGNGGGIYAFGPTIIRESTINDNVARDGGGIDVSSSSAFLYAINSTISRNGAYNNGGGIHSVGGSGNIVGLYSASVVSNDASTDSDQVGQGGGIYATVAGGARFIIANTLVGDNTINGRDAFNDCVGSVEAYGFNLFSMAVPPGCTIGGNGATAWGQISLQTIGPLQDNDGPTFTHALLQTSEAINGTTNQGCIDENGTALSNDQRGAPRVSGFRCDVGAYEYGAVVDVIFKDGFE